MSERKKIVVSAVNIIEGGTLSILKDFSEELHLQINNDEYEVIYLLNNKDLLKRENSTVLAFPKIKKSWLLRILFEYVYCYFLSLKLKPDIWISLLDMSANVKAKKVITYCHNPTPFFDAKLKHFHYDKTFYLMSKLFKYLYGFNIKSNTMLIVQQSWLKEKFQNLFKLSSNVVKVSYPVKEKSIFATDVNSTNKCKKLFYPSFPRPFKNFEVIFEAASKLGCEYEFYITIDGTENNYSREMKRKYGEIRNIKWIGRINREQVYKLYDECDALLFPSLLETWGLPMSEAASKGMKIIASDKNFCREVLADYKNVVYFDPNNSNDLVNSIQNFNEALSRVKKEVFRPDYENWNQLVQSILS